MNTYKYFQRTTNCTQPNVLVIWLAFEKFTRANLLQTVLAIILLLRAIH